VSRERAPVAQVETSDFYLACYLRAVGYELVDLRREGRRASFVFAGRPDHRETTMAYYNGKGLVPPLGFAAAVKDLKSILHAT
jgi:hypothetical protein